jgi:tetratricopeptide (TPR) repeat protein
MRARLVVLSITLMLCGCTAGNSDYDVRFFEKYLLDGERAMQDNDGERAERMFRISLSHGEKLGAGDWRLAVAEGRLAKALLANEKADQAKAVLTSSIMHFRGLKPELRSRISLVAKEQGEAESLLGLMLVESGDINGSRAYLEEASALLAPFWPPAEQEKERDTIAGIGYARALYGLARVEQHDGDAENAVKNYKTALSVIDEEEIPVPIREDIAASYAAFLSSKGKSQLAESVKEAQQHYARFNPGGAKAVARDAWRELFGKARSAAKHANYAEARVMLEDAYKRTGIYAMDGEDALNTLCELARVSQRMKDETSATKYVEQAEAVAIKLGGSEKSLYYDNVLLTKNKILRLQGKSQELEDVLKKQIALREELRGHDNFHVGEILSHLGECQFHLHKQDEGEASLRRAISIFKQLPQRNHRELKEAYERLIPALEKVGKTEDAAKLKAEREQLIRDSVNWKNE